MKESPAVVVLIRKSTLQMTLSQILYWAIIAFMLADFGIGLWLTLLNIKASRWPIPKVLEGLYDDEKYR